MIVVRTFLLYNSLTHRRDSVVRIHSDHANVEVKDELGNVVPTQVDPFWIDSTMYSNSIFKVTFDCLSVLRIALKRNMISPLSCARNSFYVLHLELREFMVLCCRFRDCGVLFWQCLCVAR